MKRLISIMVSLVLIITIFPASYSESITPNELIINETNIQLAFGKTIKLTAHIDNKPVKPVWESDNTEIATVSKSGVVSAKSPGKAQISCIVSKSEDDDNKLIAACEVEVYLPVKKISLAKSMTINVGQKTEPMQVTVTPEEATYKGLKWNSDDESIATVDEKGSITGVAPGKCKITCISSQPHVEKEKIVSCAIQITVVSPVKSIILNNNEPIQIGIGQKLSIEAKADPDDADIKSLEWKSADQTIATVKNGTVVGMQEGDTIISASMENVNGDVVSSEVELHVFVPVTTVKIKEEKISVSLYPGNRRVLHADISPDNAEYDSVKWITSDPTVAQIDEDTGELKGINPGNATITAISVEPNINGKQLKKASIKVSVLRKIDYFTLSYPYVVYVGLANNRIKITNIKPTNASEKKFYFVSSENDIISITDDGMILPWKTGVANVNVIAKDGMGASRTAKIWCFDKDYTLDNVFPGMLSSYKKLTVETKYCANAMATIAVSFLYAELAINKQDHSLLFDKTKESYCLVGSNQIWCCFKNSTKPGYQVYGYINYYGHDYVTYFYYNSNDTTEKLKKEFDLRFDDKFVVRTVPGNILETEVMSTLNMFNAGLR